MNAKRLILSLLTILVSLSIRGQVLPDGISGRDRLERYLFIQAISPQGDTCMVMTDSLGRFEIDPGLMVGMPGNVYLKPMVTKPKPILVIDSPFDSIDVYRQKLVRYQVQDLAFRTENEDAVFYYAPETTLLDESTVKAKRYSIGRDKMTGYLDSLTILTCPEWVCEHGYLNDYQGYSHHPNGCFDCSRAKKRMTPKRGKEYHVIKYIPWPDDPDGRWIVDMSDPPHEIIYYGPQYTEEELLEMYGMWKAQGYYPQREFYEPDEIELASPTPDYRNLLQWKPAVLTDENGVAEITFEASDVNTEFIGIIEAVDGTGGIGTRTFTFRVYKF